MRNGTGKSRTACGPDSAGLNRFVILNCFSVKQNRDTDDNQKDSGCYVEPGASITSDLVWAVLSVNSALSA